MIRYFKLALVVIWMGIIFIMSHKPVEESWNLSTQITDGLIDKAENVGMEKVSFNVDMDTLTVYIRKAAHIFEFFILFVLMYLCLKDFNLSKPIILTIVITILYAASDEFHQLFVPGRDGKVMDVIIDSIGVIIGIPFVLIMEKIKLRYNKNNPANY